MPQVAINIIKHLKGYTLEDFVMTGEGARMAGCDGRTFKQWAKKLNITPIGKPGGKEIYRKADAEKVAAAYKAKK